MKAKENPARVTPEVQTASRKIYVAIVSHGHAFNIAEELRPHTWREHRDKIVPIILSNIPDQDLSGYCDTHDLTLLKNETTHGFGANNNKIYNYARKHLGLDKGDFFFCINPDIITTPADIIKLSEIMVSNRYSVAAPDLRKPDGTPDDNIRAFPSLSDIVYRYLFNSKKSNVEKESNHENMITDWASGAFLCFRASTYEEINGFDERYFMYYEDADICRRGKSIGQPTYYIPSITATHIGNRQSRGLPTKQLVYHVTSAIRFALSKPE